MLSYAMFESADGCDWSRPHMKTGKSFTTLDEKGFVKEIEENQLFDFDFSVDFVKFLKISMANMISNP
jgi:hypothetical protein